MLIEFEGAAGADGEEGKNAVTLRKDNYLAIIADWLPYFRHREMTCLKTGKERGLLQKYLKAVPGTFTSCTAIRNKHPFLTNFNKGSAFLDRFSMWIDNNWSFSYLPLSHLFSMMRPLQFPENHLKRLLFRTAWIRNSERNGASYASYPWLLLVHQPTHVIPHTDFVHLRYSLNPPSVFQLPSSPPHFQTSSAFPAFASYSTPPSSEHISPSLSLGCVFKGCPWTLKNEKGHRWGGWAQET